MKKKIVSGILACAASGLLAYAQSVPAPQPASTDSEMTSKIRQALMDDSTVGSAAQHIRVNTKNGVVTLRGRVDSSQEKDEALAKAKQIAGDANVKDEMSIKK
jgi:osmotically-inducible protein OsmY